MTNVNNISHMFNNCYSLSSIPNISKWSVINIIDMSYMFNNCYSLSSLPDISKWYDTYSLDINFIFSNCQSLVSLPNIIKWRDDQSNCLNFDDKNSLPIFSFTNSFLKNLNLDRVFNEFKFLNLVNCNSHNIGKIVINSNNIFQNCISVLDLPNNNNNYSLKELNKNFDNIFNNNNLFKNDKIIPDMKENNNKKNYEELKSLLINSDNKISITKNIIKGALEIELNETNKDIFLFKTDISNGIDIYLSKAKI